MVGNKTLALINKGFITFLDELAEAQAQIFISSGERGTQIKLALAALRNLTKARLAGQSYSS